MLYHYSFEELGLLFSKASDTAFAPDTALSEEQLEFLETVCGVKRFKCPDFDSQDAYILCKNIYFWHDYKFDLGLRGFYDHNTPSVQVNSWIENQAIPRWVATEMLDRLIERLYET